MPVVNYYDVYKDAAKKLTDLTNSNPELAGMADRLFNVELAYNDAIMDLEVLKAENERLRDDKITKTNQKLLLDLFNLDISMDTRPFDKIAREKAALMEGRSVLYKREIEELKAQLASVMAELDGRVFDMPSTEPVKEATEPPKVAEPTSQPEIGAFGEKVNAPL